MDQFFQKETSNVRGDKYIAKKVRVVSFACDMPTGPPFHPYQIWNDPQKNKGNM